MKMTIVITFVKNDMLKIILNPNIGSLNDYLGLKMNKILSKSHIEIIFRKIYHLLEEFIINYEIY